MRSTNTKWIGLLWFPVLCALLSTDVAFSQDEKPTDQCVIVVVGAPGTDEYKQEFQTWAGQWKSAASHTKFIELGTGESVNDKQNLKTTIEKIREDATINEAWIVLIGHGTFDGKRAKFNLRGPDIEATEMANWLKPLTQRLVIVNCSSSSSPFINALSGKNRVVVTATKNGFQYNFSRFGGYFANSINDPAIDLDKDGQTSVLEAFCAAAQSVGGFYSQENRLATEHGLIDDNGDSLGTPAEWFDGVRTKRNPKRGIADGVMANQIFLQRRGVDAKLTVKQRVRRNELEKQLEQLRSSKSTMDESQYLSLIEPILIELAKVYDGLD